MTLFLSHILPVGHVTLLVHILGNCARILVSYCAFFVLQTSLPANAWRRLAEQGKGPEVILGLGLAFSLLVRRPSLASRFPPAWHHPYRQSWKDQEEISIRDFKFASMYVVLASLSLDFDATFTILIFQIPTAMHQGREDLPWGISSRGLLADIQAHA